MTKMESEIKNYTKTCEPCQKNKLVQKKHNKAKEITTTSINPFESVFLDIC